MICSILKNFFIESFKLQSYDFPVEKEYKFYLKYEDKT